VNNWLSVFHDISSFHRLMVRSGTLEIIIDVQLKQAGRKFNGPGLGIQLLKCVVPGQKVSGLDQAL